MKKLKNLLSYENLDQKDIKSFILLKIMIIITLFAILFYAILAGGPMWFFFHMFILVNKIYLIPPIAYIILILYLSYSFIVKYIHYSGKKIPQILFSIILLGLTIGTFYYAVTLSLKTGYINKYLIPINSKINNIEDNEIKNFLINTFDNNYYIKSIEIYDDGNISNLIYTGKIIYRTNDNLEKTLKTHNIDNFIIEEEEIKPEILYLEKIDNLEKYNEFENSIAKPRLIYLLNTIIYLIFGMYEIVEFKRITEVQ